MNLVYVGVLPPHTGGSAISMAEILTGLAGRGHTVRAVSPITAEAMAQGDAFAEASPGISLTRYLVPWFHTGPDRPEPPSYRAAQTAHLERLVPPLFGREGSDLLLIGRESFAWCVTDRVRRLGIPVVQRLGGSTTAGLLAGRFPEPQASEMRAALRRAHIRIAVGRELACAARRLDIGDILAIPTGVDLDRFRPCAKDPALLRQLELDPDSVIAAHVSNLTAMKRSMDFVQAAVATATREPRLAYLVVGDGALRDTMEASCRAAGIAHRFRFVGWRAYEEMPRYFALADMVVMPSESEGLARTYLETQASGRVLVASDIPPAREVVRHLETGLVFPRGDVGALSQAMLTIASDPALRRSIGDAARHRAEARSMADMLTDYEQVLTQATARSRLRVAGLP